MPRGGTVDDLEVIDDDDPTAPQGPAGPVRTRRRKWPILIVVLAVLAVVVAFPVRTEFAKGEFVRLQRRWVQVDALNVAHKTAVDRIQLLANPDDSAVVTEARKAVSREHARRLEPIAGAIHGEYTPDHALRRLRSTMLHATRADLEDLRRDRWIASTAAARHRAAQTLLDEQGKRWRRTALPKVKYPDFRPVTASAVQTLSRYLDEPTGARLLGVKDGSFIDIDVDRSNEVDKHFDEFSGQGPNGNTSDVLPRDGYVVILTGNGVYTIGTALDQPPKFLGDATNVFPSTRADAFWAARVRSGTDVSGATAIQLDRNGTVLAGPIESGGPALWVFDESTGRVATPRDGIEGELLARHGDTLAYAEWHEVANVTLGSMTQRVSRPVPNPPRLIGSELCRFSPDGRTLACIYEPDPSSFGGSTPAGRLVLIDAATGAPTVIDGSAGLQPIADLRWSPNGDRVFVASASPHPVATYRMGDTKVRPLRYVGPQLDRFVVLPASS